MANDLIVKSNNLVEGFMNLPKNEYKLILYLISRIKKEDKDFMVQKVSVKEFANVMNYKGDSVYTYMKAFEVSLASRKISIKYSNGNRLTLPWFGYLKYFNNTGILKISFNENLKPFLLELDVNFTKYSFKNIKGLSSVHAIRIYELLKQYQKSKDRTIEIEELRQMLGITPSQYKLYGHLKSKVLNTAQKQLTENKDTDLTFNVHEIKTGRKVSAIKFNIKLKNNTESDKTIDESNKNKKEIIINQMKHQIKNKLGIDISSKDLIILIENHSEVKINYCIDNLYKIISLSAPKDQIFNYFKNAIIKNWNLEKLTIPTRIPQHNFEQRTYSDEEYSKYYSNVK